MFCTRCGTQMPQGAASCPRCGAPAEGGQPAKPAQSAPKSTPQPQPQPQSAPKPDKAAEKARRAEEKARLAQEKAAQRDAALAAREKEKARLAQEKAAQRDAALGAKEKEKAQRAQEKAAKSAQRAPVPTPQRAPVPTPQQRPAAGAPVQTGENERRISTGRLILLILAVVAIVAAAAVIAAVLLLGEPKGSSHGGGGGGGGPTQGLTERDLTPTERELFERVVDELPDTLESDLQEAYGALPKGYTAETDVDDFSFIPTTDYNLFYLQGYFFVRDNAAGSSADPYRVDVTGMVSTEQTRETYQTNLFVDCQKPGEQATPTEHYILPTDSQYITYDDLYPLSKEEVSLARNEIYARYGYSFKDADIRAYFEAQSWYTADPNVNASTFDPSVFNAYERANLATIIQFEKDNGWR